jgi:RNA polymerase sigma factor (sigma-70 family)
MRDDQDARQLYQRCISNDPAALRVAWADLGAFLLSVTRSRLRSKPELVGMDEDCAQEALLAAWRKLEAGNGPQPERFLSWAATIAIHKTYDALRRRGYRLGEREADAAPGRRKRIPPALLASLEALTGADDPTTAPLRLADERAIDPEDKAGRSEAFARLALELGRHPKLSDASRTVLGEGFLGDQEDDELARMLATSRANVQVIRSRNLTKLRTDAPLLERLRAFYEGGA